MSQPESDKPFFHVLVDNQRYGPYPADELENWIAVGKITPDTLVSDGGPWITARKWLVSRAKQSVQSMPPPLKRSAAGSDPISVADLQPGDSAIGWGSSAQSAAAPSKPPSPNPASVSPSRESEAQSLGDEDLVEQTPRDYSPPERDRIVVIGRRQSGKTIYLASVYARLWRSLDGMTAKAVSGEVHRQLMTSYQTLKSGKWPAATLGTTQVAMEVEHAGRKRLMVTLDFAGEMFRKAFVEEQADFPGVAELTDHIDRAAAVLLLVDPSVAAGMDHDAAMDDDFGIVQAVQRIRNWPGGEKVPIALVLTKSDQHQGLIDHSGGAKGFVRHHFPALVRLLKTVPIFQVAAVQIEKGANGTIKPRADFEPINVEGPLKFCLDQIDRAQEKAELHRQETERMREEARLAKEEEQQERRTNFILILVISLILLGGLVGVVLVLMSK